jgi:putative serine protease PepD
MTVVASLVAGAAGGWIAGRESAGSSNTAASGATVPSTRTVSAELSGNDLDVAAILAKVGPSVVAVNTQVTQRRGPYIAQGQGAGTGVVLTADGQILTNAHVIDGATAITVSVEGSDQQLPATLVAKDTANDLALLQVTGVSDLTPATLGDSDATIVGDDVVAVGNALALEGGMSVTRGIVSALHRSIEAGSESGSESLSGLIQTDAAISSGNSGGPLVNSKGEVIGINTAVAGSGNGTTASNIGFAIPIDTAKTIVERLRTSGG